jgi:hypothetical protein
LCNNWNKEYRKRRSMSGTMPRALGPSITAEWDQHIFLSFLFFFVVFFGSELNPSSKQAADPPFHPQRSPSFFICFYLFWCESTQFPVPRFATTIILAFFLCV